LAFLNHDQAKNGKAAIVKFPGDNCLRCCSEVVIYHVQLEKYQFPKFSPHHFCTLLLYLLDQLFGKCPEF